MTATAPAIVPSIDQATLLQWLAQARLAYHQLMIGTNVTTVSYADGGGGTRLVTYTRTSLQQLSAYIAQLEVAIGGRRARAIGIVF